MILHHTANLCSVSFRDFFCYVSPYNLINSYSTLASERKTAKINVKKLESLKYSVKAQKSQRENSKNHFGFESL